MSAMAMPRSGRYAPYGVRHAPAVAPVVVYGTRWCAATQAVRRHLDRLGVPYRYVDIERDPEAANRLRWMTGGTLSHPTVSVAGEVLVEPSLRELDWALSRVGLR
jgi:mycoredoxin